MPKKIISEQQVIDAAKLLVANGQALTLAAIRCQLGKKGGNATIHKYLLKWKEFCYKQANNKIPFQVDHNNEEEKKKLRQTLNKYITQNENYAQELITAEKNNIELKEKINQLQRSNQELQLRLINVETTNNALEKITQKIQKELNLNTNETIRTMQQTIDNLRSELKTLNETSLIAVRETSSKGHEALMQEKVTSINLQTKIDLLTKELLENKKQLELANSKAHVHAQSLKRQIDQQQKILKNYLNSAQLQELAQGMEINYTLLEIGCGK